MRLGTLAFFCGILICQHLNDFSSSYSILLCGLALLIAWYFSVIRLLILVVLGCIWMTWRTHMIVAQVLPPVLEGQTVTVVGHIIDLPEWQSKQWKFLFVPNHLVFNGRHYPSPGRILLRWYEPPQSLVLRPNQEWQFTVRLKKAHSHLNPLVFDYSQWLFQHRIRATGTVYKKAEQLLLRESTFSLNGVRYHLVQTVKQVLDTNPYTGMLLALTVGVQNDISKNQWEILRQSGTIHLMTISGLHIGLIAWLTFRITNWLWCFLGYAPLRLPAPRFAAWASLCMALVYSLLAGFSIPIQRAFIMVVVAMSNLLLNLSMSTSQILALALFAVLLYDPLAVLSAGFWLSFGAVALLLYGLHSAPVTTEQSPSSHESTLSLFKESQRLRKWHAFFYSQWIAFIGLMPPLLFMFGSVPLISFIANWIAIPWVTFVVVPLALIGVLCLLPLPQIATFILQIAGYILQNLWVSLEYLTQFKWAVWQQATPPLWAVIVGMIGVLILLSPFRWREKGLVALVWLSPLFCLPDNRPPLGGLDFTLLDVGQGLAIVIRTHNHVLVYDTGPGSQTGFSMGEAVISPFLKASGVKQIDTLVISHIDTDHSSGVSSLLRHFPVTRLLTSEAMPLLNRPMDICQTGDKWHWDGVTFDILHPPPDYLGDSNNRSCVLKITAAKQSILLVGDIRKEVEYGLIQRYAQRLQSDVLVVPHHGSRNSSSESFIEAVNPKVALFSVGYRNSFGFPKPDIVNRYVQRGVKVFNTVDAGAITIPISHDGIIKPRLAREELKRYWHD